MNLPKADTLSIMTKELHHLFLVNGCNPTCHCCNNSIRIDAMFKLASVSEYIILKASALEGNPVFKSSTPHDVMLCDNVKCTPYYMVKNRIEQLKEYKAKGLSANGLPVRRGGCSIINGKIVP
jgi:hypothetical protein